jgi:glycerophosphoryl diester phosphodiesterase
MQHFLLVIGHRGASREAPENTLAAFRLAWEEGADGIEADFRLTRDGHIVCLHDASTGRTADHDLAVADATLAELRRLDAGGWKGARWRGEKIPTLAEVLDISPPGKRLFLEIKSGPEIIPALMHELAGKGGAAERITLLSFSAPLLAACKERMPEVKVCWLTDYRRSRSSGALCPTRAEILDTLARIGADGLASRAHRALDADLVAALRDAGLSVHVWTVDSVAKARHYAELGVDSIMSNRPGWLKTHLAEHEPF